MCVCVCASLCLTVYRQCMEGWLDSLDSGIDTYMNLGKLIELIFVCIVLAFVFENLDDES